ncbi:MAG: hypothetical protein ACE5KE_13070, partial [Methanosarcinales archaeon]
MYFKYEQNKFRIEKLSKLVSKLLGKELPITSQILVDVKLKKMDGNWTDKIQMMLDTGAVISLLPMTWYNEVVVSQSVDYVLYGANRKEDCSLEVKVAEVTMMLEYDKNKSNEFNNFISFYVDAP